MQNKYCQNCRINTKQVFVESIWRCEECFNTHSEFLPHPESLLHEIALAGSHIIQLNEEIKRLQAENEKLISEATTNDFILLELNDMLKEKQQRVQEIEQERRWIHQDKTMIAKKDGDSWCFVLPDFINLQESEAKFMDAVLSSFIDRIYTNLLPHPPKEVE